MKSLIPFLILLCGCEANQPAVKPIVVNVVAKSEPLPVQTYLNITCSNSIILPDEYTVWRTNSTPSRRGSGTALEVPATAYEDVDVPVPAGKGFVWACNQIGE